jgi:predicted TIM-barrel fold metal-dependent hydrolase
MHPKLHYLMPFSRFSAPELKTASRRRRAQEFCKGPMSRLLLLLVLAVAAGACQQRPAKQAQTQTPASTAPAAVRGPFTPAELQAFSALSPIDTHTHVFATDPAFTAMLKKLDLHVVTICVYDLLDHQLKGSLSEEVQRAQAFVKSSDGHGSLCTTFNAFPFEKPGFAQAANRQLNHDFAEGAIAVKIWKNIGMEIKDKNGHYILPDNPAYEPIYRDIAAHNKTLIAHLAEPDSCWKPMDPASPDYEYYKTHPEWYMYQKPGAPSKEEILRARDHLVAENPNLRVVGAHLGSLESNFDELGEDFDKYPNFAVDTAARMPYVMMLPRDRAIAFITKYQDRLIYGTDLQFRPGTNAQRVVKTWENYYANDWRFLATSDWVEYKGKKYQGLDLPQPILEKIYHSNAVHWFPGILNNQH